MAQVDTTYGTYRSAPLFIPEVIADLIDTKLIDNIVFAPLAMIDNTLAAGAGDTVKLPYYGYIGMASDVSEGYDIPLAKLTQTTVSVSVEKYGKAIQITDEAVLSGYGDPIGEGTRQLVTAIADKVDAKLLAALAANSASAQNYTGASTGDSVEVGEIELNDEALSRKMTLKGIPENAEIVWSSADESIATVDQEGVITAVSSGTTTVTALIDSIKYNVKVNVSISSRPSVGSDMEIVGLGNTAKLNATGFSETPEWISMNKDVATVDENGVVTAVGYGEAVIVANSSTYSAKITVKVVPGYIPGDATNDGQVTVSDIVAVLQYSVNKKKYPLTDQGYKNAEVTGDGDVAADDAFYIQQFDAGLIEELPVK